MDDMSKESTELTTIAAGIIVKDAVSSQAATDTIGQIKWMRKKIDGVFKPMHDDAKAAAAKVKQTWDQMNRPLDDAEQHLRAEIARFVAEETRRVAEENRKRMEEARAKEDEERKKRELAEALFGDEVAPDPEPIQEIVLEERVKVDGQSVRSTWSAEVADIVALARAVADGAVPAELILPNQVALNSMARALKGAFAVPGVKAVEKQTVAIR